MNLHKTNKYSAETQKKKKKKKNTKKKNETKVCGWVVRWSGGGSCDLLCSLYAFVLYFSFCWWKISRVVYSFCCNQVQVACLHPNNSWYALILGTRKSWVWAEQVATMSYFSHCQRCHAGLKLDPSLRSVSDALLQQISELFVKEVNPPPTAKCNVATSPLSSSSPEVESGDFPPAPLLSSPPPPPPSTIPPSPPHSSPTPPSPSSPSSSKEEGGELPQQRAHTSYTPSAAASPPSLSPARQRNTMSPLARSPTFSFSRQLSTQNTEAIQSIRERFKKAHGHKPQNRGHLGAVDKNFASADDILSGANSRSKSVILSKLFELISDATGLAQPLCNHLSTFFFFCFVFLPGHLMYFFFLGSSCMQHAFATVERNLDEACRDNEAYQAYLKTIEPVEESDVDLQLEQVLRPLHSHPHLLLFLFFFSSSLLFCWR